MINLHTELLKEHSKAQTRKVAAYIGNDKKKFKELIDFLLANEDLIAQRAAWAVRECFQAFPHLIVPYIPILIKHLKKDVHDAVKRNILAILSEVEIQDEDNLGTLTDICFKLLQNAQEPVAVRVHCMSVLYNTIKVYPELKEELLLIIKEQLPYESAGYTSRAKKIIKALS